MKEQKTISDLNTKIQNLRDSFDTSDEMYIELDSIVEDLIQIEDNPYQKMWEELKTKPCVNEPYDDYYGTGGEQTFEDIFSTFKELENKYLGVDKNE